MQVKEYHYRMINKTECVGSLITSVGAGMAWFMFMGGLLSSIGVFALVVGGWLVVQLDTLFPPFHIKVELAEGEGEETKVTLDDEPERTPSPGGGAIMDFAKKRAAAFVAGQVKKRL